jgi:hypothetical protein
MILLIFYEIMYVFLKLQIFCGEILTKNERITKITKNEYHFAYVLHYFQ